MKYDLNRYFTDLEFNSKAHRYFIGDTELTPVSNIVKLFYPEFMAYSVSMKIGKKYKVNPAALRKKWDKIRDDACNSGTDTHAFAEEYAINGQQYKRLTDREKSVVRWYKHLKPNYKIAAVEYLMYSEKYGIAGTADLILFDKNTGKFIIGDWKTNKDLFKNYNFQYMYPPFEYFLDTPFNHYVIQLTLYKMLFELGTGYEVEGMKIIWLAPDKQYHEYDLPDVTAYLKPYLDEYRKNHRTYSVNIL